MVAAARSQAEEPVRGAALTRVELGGGGGARACVCECLCVCYNETTTAGVS